MTLWRHYSKLSNYKPPHTYMKTILLLTSLLAVSSLGAFTILDINDGLLANEPKVAFKGGSTKVRLDNGDFFKMQGFGDRVELQSVSTKDWSFDNKVIYSGELPLADIYNLSQSDILTITATARHDNLTEYAVGLIKYFNNGKLTIRAVSVHPVPEPNTFALLAGLFAFFHVAMKRRAA